jgi:uncharacterized sulfatase
VSRHDWAGYYNEINKFGSAGRCYPEKSEAENLAKNTIVCVFADHGRPMIRGKNWLYDSGTRIPLIIYFPEGMKKPKGYQAGKTNTELLSAIDSSG